MMSQIFSLWLLSLLLVMQPVFAKNYPVYVGNQLVLIQKNSSKKSQNQNTPTYIHLHQNETTALKAARFVIKKRGGTLITLVHSGNRNIKFSLHKKKYAFDPNRIFSEQGIKKTLAENSNYNPEAATQVQKLALKIKKLIPRGTIIAVHNNQRYSFKSYFKTLAKDVQKINYNPHKYYRNFLLVTNKKDFLRFKKAGLNTVWQKSHPLDDGSLSIYLAKRRYMNIEAGYNQLAEQKICCGLLKAMRPKLLFFFNLTC